MHFQTSHSPTMDSPVHTFICISHSLFRIIIILHLMTSFKVVLFCGHTFCSNLALIQNRISPLLYISRKMQTNVVKKTVHCPNKKDIDLLSIMYYYKNNILTMYCHIVMIYCQYTDDILISVRNLHELSIYICQ